MYFVLFLFFQSVSSLRLVFFVPTLSYSHVSFNAQFCERFVDQGHHVTMIQAVVDDEVIYNSSRFEVIRKYVGVAPGEARELLWTRPGPFEEASPLDPKILWKLAKVSNLFVKICKALMEDSVFLEEIRDRQFDIGFLEQYDSCGFGFFSAAKISHVSWLSATLLFSPQSHSVGVSQPLSYLPELFLPSNQALTITRRAQNVLVSLVTSTLFQFTRWRQTSIFKGRYGLSQSYDLGVSSANMSTSVVLNSSPVFDLPHPISQEFVHAGITMSDRPLRLPQKWAVVASKSPFVLVSFGSIASFSSMPPEMKEPFLDTFSSFPSTTFIVKWENAPKRLPGNVVVSDWLPQKALVDHNNFRAIITHGGWSSVLETVASSRPLLIIPLFADHWKNSRVVSEKGVGVVLDKRNITVGSLSSALTDILTDNRYTTRARQLSRMLKHISPPSLLDVFSRTTKRPTRTLVRPILDVIDFSPFAFVLVMLCFSF